MGNVRGRPSGFKHYRCGGGGGVDSCFFFSSVLANTEALGVNPEDATFRLGPKLEFDAASERFVGNKKANKLLTRNYRKPFVVPDEV